MAVWKSRTVTVNLVERVDGQDDAANAAQTQGRGAIMVRKTQLEARGIGVVTIALGALLLAFPAPATATSLDLTGATESGFINFAFFTRTDTQPTGTGVIDSFVRLNDNSGTVEGYNTTVNGVLNNLSDDTHNRALLLIDIPLVTLNGIVYREFLLDINENGKDPFVTLDEIQIFQSGTPNQDVTSFVPFLPDPDTDPPDVPGARLALADSDLVYRLDPDSVILLDYRLNHGSGSGDMLAYIPEEFFEFDGDYVYLYSHFGYDFIGGNDYNEDAGFEEWAVRTIPIPEPSTLALLSLGLGLLVRRKRT